MNWLDILRDRGLEAMQPAADSALVPIAKPSEPQPAPDIRCAWFQTRAPRDGDLGEIYPAHYSVADGIVTMRDESGKPTGEKYQLRAGEDPHQAAGRLGRQAWTAARGESHFNRPIIYGPLSIA